MPRTALSLGAALLFLASAIPAAAAAYTGEAVVRPLGSKALMVALDEAGHGVVTHTFVMRMHGSLPAGLALRSAHAEVEYRKDAIYVTLPSAHRRLKLPYPSGDDNDDSAKSSPDPAPVRQANGITEIDGMSGFSDGVRFLAWKRTVTLDDVEADRLPRSLEDIGRFYDEL